MDNRLVNHKIYAVGDNVNKQPKSQEVFQKWLQIASRPTPCVLCDQLDFTDSFSNRISSWNISS